VRERLVGLGHAVRVFALLHGAAAQVAASISSLASFSSIVLPSPRERA
jgi:hypothetical protein